MQVTYQRIKFHQVWSSLPSMAGINEYPKPLRPTIIEPIVDDFTEEQLIELIISTVGSFGGGSINLAALHALPEGFVKAAYQNIRYQRPLPDGMFPIRANHYFSSSFHALTSLVLMNRAIYGLYLTHANRIEPDMATKADNLLRLLRQIEHSLFTILKTNPTADRGDLLVFSGQTITDAVGVGENSYSESKYVVYFDADRLSEYEAAGGNAEEAAQWWFDNKTQPPFPEDE